MRTDAEEAAAPGGPGDLLFGAYRHRVLSLLFLRPGDSFHVRMIARLTAYPLARCTANCGCSPTRTARCRAHRQPDPLQRQRAVPVFDELAALLEKTAGAPPVLEDHSASTASNCAQGNTEEARSRARAARR